MLPKLRIFIGFFLGIFLLTAGSIPAADEPKSSETEKKPKISLSEDMSKVMMREAVKVKEELEQQAQ